jgi:hypothetical protein
MSAITQADVTVTQTMDDEDYTGQRTNRMFPVVSFGDSQLTYDTYGIPLPDLSKFRLKFYIKRIHIQTPPGAYMWTFDPTARAANPVAPYGTLRAYSLNGGAEMSGAVAATSLPLEIVGA